MALPNLPTPSRGYEDKDVYRDAAGQLRAMAGKRMQWGVKGKFKPTLLASDGSLYDPSMMPESADLGGADAQKKKRKQAGLYSSNRSSGPSNDYSLMNQNTLLGG